VPGSTLLINVDTFDTRNLDKAGYAQNPLRDNSLVAYRVYEIPMTSITVEATKPLGREAARRRALEELLRARPHLLDVHTRRPLSTDQEALRTGRVLEANPPRSRRGAAQPLCDIIKKKKELTNTY
jgi:hypothetical protein